MKRVILAGLLVLGSAATLSAGVLFPRTDVRELAVDVMEVKTMNISSTTYSAVLDMTVFTSTVNVWAVEVYVPKGQTQTINCGFSVSLTTSSADTAYSNYGREVSPGSGVLWQANFGDDKNLLYCRAQGQESAGVKTRATITVAR